MRVPIGLFIYFRNSIILCVFCLPRQRFKRWVIVKLFFVDNNITQITIFFKVKEKAQTIIWCAVDRANYILLSIAIRGAFSRFSTGMPLNAFHLPTRYCHYTFKNTFFILEYIYLNVQELFDINHLELLFLLCMLYSNNYLSRVGI